MPTRRLPPESPPPAADLPEGASETEPPPAAEPTVLLDPHELADLLAAEKAASQPEQPAPPPEGPRSGTQGAHISAQPTRRIPAEEVERLRAMEDQPATVSAPPSAAEDKFILPPQGPAPEAPAKVSAQPTRRAAELNR